MREENTQRKIRLFDIQEAQRQHPQNNIDIFAQSGENMAKADKQSKIPMKNMDNMGVMDQ